MKIVVTGSSGKLGRYVVSDLISRGYTVVAVDRRPPKEENGIETKSVDLTRYDEFLPLLEGVDAICHLANIPFIDQSYAEGFSNNVTSTYVIFEAALKAGVRNIVNASSIQATGLFRSRYPERVYSVPLYLPVDEDHPNLTQDTYPLSKAMGEFIAESFVRRDPTLQVFSLRFSGVTTPEMHRRWLEWMAQKLKPDFKPDTRRHSKPEKMADALGTYIHVHDAARAVRLSLEAKRPGHTALNIVAPRSMYEWFEADLIEAYGKVPEFRQPVDSWSALISPARARDVLGFCGEFLPNGERIADLKVK